MKHYFITGTSSGLGKALAEAVLPDAMVQGYSRRCTIDHPHYTHHTIDFLEPGAVAEMQLQLPEESEGVMLINNAGMIGEIRRVGEFPDSHYEEVFRLNAVIPAQITDRFLSQARRKNYPCILLNISSGAATNPIPSWAAYCASKAAVDMFTRTVSVELQEVNCNHVRVFSLYPGVVDTPMQAHIRGTSEENFSSIVRFREYKESNLLFTPEAVTAAILRIFKDPETLTDVVINIREHLQ